MSDNNAKQAEDRDREATKEPQYRLLSAGEIIQEGDEVDASNGWEDPPWWIPSVNVGRAVPDPRYISHAIYRRKVE